MTSTTVAASNACAQPAASVMLSCSQSTLQHLRVQTFGAEGNGMQVLMQATAAMNTTRKSSITWRSRSGEMPKQTCTCRGKPASTHNMCASLHDALAQDLCTKTPKTHALRYCSVSFELRLRNHIFAKFRAMLKIRFVVLESSIAVAMNSTSMLQSCHYSWI